MPTPYNGFDLPVVGADADTWGGKLNAILTAVDTLLSSPANTFKGNNTGAQVSTMNLTPAQAVAMLPSPSIGVRGVVPAAGAGDTNRPLVGDGTFKKGIGRACGAYATLGPTSASLVTGINVASVSFVSTDGNFSIAQVTFSNAMTDTNYQIAMGYETSGADPIINTVSISNKTTGGFRFGYAAAYHTAVGISVFEG